MTDYAKKLEKQMDDASDAIGKVQAERDALQRAKQENDDRFMVERDQARIERDQARAALAEAVVELHRTRKTIAALTLPVLPTPVLDHVPAGGFRPHTDTEQVMLAIESLRHEKDLQPKQDIYEAINILVVVRTKAIEALAELVRLKDVKDALDEECKRIGTGDEWADRNARKNEYSIQRHIAWDVARDLLAYVTAHKEPNAPT